MLFSICSRTPAALIIFKIPGSWIVFVIVFTELSRQDKYHDILDPHSPVMLHEHFPGNGSLAGFPQHLSVNEYSVMYETIFNNISYFHAQLCVVLFKFLIKVLVV